MRIDLRKLFQWLKIHRSQQSLGRIFEEKRCEKCLAERRLQTFNHLINKFRQHRSLKKGFYRRPYTYV